MKLNGVDLDFKVSSPEDLEKYAKAREMVSAKYEDIWMSAEEPSNEQEYITLLRLGIDAFADFFDTLFGKGTADQLFGEKTNFEQVVDIYLAFVDQVQSQTKTLQEKMALFAPDTAQP